MVEFKKQSSYTVPQAPFIVDPNNSTISLVMGQQQILKCVGHAIPAPTFQWLKVNLNSVSSFDMLVYKSKRFVRMEMS